MRGGSNRRGDYHVCFPRVSGRSLHGDSFESKRVVRTDTGRSRNLRYVFYFLHGCVRTTNLDRQFARIVAKSVAVNLQGVAARLQAGIGQNLENLRAETEGIRREREPSAGKVGGNIAGSVRDAGRRRGVDLGAARYANVGSCLRAEKHLRSRFEILAR